MADIVDPTTRSRMMAAVKGKDTGPELVLRSALWEAGLRGYRVHRREIIGRPDIAWVSRKVAVFVDGAFWHGHPSAFTKGKSGEFWDRKIARNVERDKEVTQTLQADGWRVVRVWDFQVEEDLDECLSLVKEAIARCESAPR